MTLFAKSLLKHLTNLFLKLFEHQKKNTKFFLRMAAPTFSNGFIIWNCTADSLSVTCSEYDSTIMLGFDTNGSLSFKGSTTKPTVYYDVTFTGTDDEQYTGNSLINDTITIASKKAIAVVPADAENETLTITCSLSSEVNNSGFGHTLPTTGTITLDKTSILAIGAPNVKLNGNGLASDATSNSATQTANVQYDCAGAIATNDNPGTATLILNNGSSIVLTNSQLHIGSYQYGKGSLTIASSKSLTLSGSALNIGAVNNATVENAVSVSTDAVGGVTITNSIINVGGACGQNGNGKGGKGGSGVLTLSSNITDSTIFIGSGGGGGDGGAYSKNGGDGGAGILKVNNIITNSIIFLGGAGGGSSGAGGGSAGSSGGSGTLNINNTIENSIVFVGSSGGGGYYGAGGGGAGGGSAGSAGGSDTLTVSGENSISNSTVLFGMPAASGNDIKQNVSIGKIDHSVVFCGIGNYGSDSSRDSSVGGGAGGGNGADYVSYNGGGGGAGGKGGGDAAGIANGASVSLSGTNQGYITQRMIMSFKGLTPPSNYKIKPGTSSLVSELSLTTPGTEFPRFDCTGWAINTETPVNVNDVLLLYDENTSQQYISGVDGYTIFQSPFTDTTVTDLHNWIVVNPSKTYASVIEDNNGFGSIDSGVLQLDGTNYSKAINKHVIIQNNSIQTQLLAGTDSKLKGTLQIDLNKYQLSLYSTTTIGDENGTAKIIGGSNFNTIALINTTLGNEQEYTFKDTAIISSSTLSGGPYTFNAAVTISDNSKLSCSEYTFAKDFTMSNSTISADVNIQSPTTIKNCDFNKPFTITDSNNAVDVDNCTFAEDITVTPDGSSFTLTNCEINNTCSLSAIATNLILSTGEVKSKDTNGDTEQMITFTDSNSNTLELLSTTIANEKSITFATSTKLDGINLNCNMNINAFGEFSFDGSTIVLDNSSDCIEINKKQLQNSGINSSTSLYPNRIYKISTNSGVINCNIDSDFDFNQSLFNNLTISQDSDTKLYTVTNGTSALKFDQGNIQINDLGTGTFTYSPDIKLMASTLNPDNITFNTNSIQANGEGNETIPVCKFNNTTINGEFTLATGKTVTIIGSGSWTPSKASFDDNVLVLNAKEIQYDSAKGYLLAAGDYTGFDLPFGDHTVTFDGTMTLREETWVNFNITNDITIPSGLTITVNGADGENLIKFSATSIDNLGTSSLEIGTSGKQTGTEISLGTISFNNSNVKFINTFANSGTVEFSDCNSVSLRQTDITADTTLRIINSEVSMNAIEINKDTTIIDSTVNIGNSFSVNSVLRIINSDVNINGFLLNASDKDSIISSCHIEITRLITEQLEWYNAKIIVANSLMINTSEIYGTGTEVNTLTTANNDTTKYVYIGNLMISNGGSLALNLNNVYGEHDEDGNEYIFVFHGHLQVNGNVTLGTSTQTVSPLFSKNENSELILNSSNPIQGRIKFVSTDSSKQTLKINSKGSLRMAESSIFRLYSSGTEDQLITINGKFESIVPDAVYEYQKNMTLNGSIELRRSATIKGNLQIPSSGLLYIDGNASSSVPTPGTSVADVSMDGDPATTSTYTITFKESVDEYKDFYNSMPNTEVVVNYGAVSVQSLEVDKVVKPIEAKFVGNTIQVTYTNGVMIVFANDETEATISESATSTPEIFFGPSSDVYIAGQLQIFGEFYNNSSLIVNSILCCTSSSSIYNLGSIQVKGGNNNNIRGTVTIANGGALVFNGSFQDHPGSNLNVSENSTLTVNDSLSIGTTTTSLEIKPRNIPQKFNVLINNQLTTKSPQYLIQPAQDDGRESIYLSLTTDEKLEEYKVSA